MRAYQLDDYDDWDPAQWNSAFREIKDLKNCLLGSVHQIFKVTILETNILLCVIGVKTGFSQNIDLK